MDYSRKKAKRGEGVEDILFWNPGWNFSFIYFTPGNSRQIKAAPLEIVQNAKLHYITWKFQDQKPRPLEFAHIFFLVTPGNSICYFFDTPGDSIISSTHPVRFFSGIAQNVKMVCVFFFQLILVGTLSILILSVKNRGWGFFLLNEQNPLSVTKVICQQSLN